MLIHSNTKAVSVHLRRHARPIRSGLTAAFEHSVVGCRGEVRFFRDLISALELFFNALVVPGANFHCRTAETHQKPVVKFGGKACELADLLVVVKYHLLSGIVEKKSILYQVKMAGAGSLKCKIDPTQLELLKHWPPFTFGRVANGGARTYTITPQTLEFGSFMLEPRNISKSKERRYRRGYGSAPSAHTVRAYKSSDVPIHGLPYTRSDVDSIFSQLIFEAGEHHSNAEVEALVSALYRHLGLAPDPPSEFEDYFSEKHVREENSDEEEVDFFAILEINVTETEEVAERGGARRRMR